MAQTTAGNTGYWRRVAPELSFAAQYRATAANGCRQAVQLGRVCATYRISFGRFLSGRVHHQDR